MRRRLATALCLLTAVPVVAGCGSSSSGSGAKSPLDEALGYLPKSAPFVVAIDTDPNGAQWKSLSANVKKFPFSGQIQSALRSSVDKSGLSFDNDIKPLLGNEAVVGSPTVQAFTQGNTQVIGALEVKDKGKLSSILGKSKDLKKDGSSNGATLYRQTSGGGETAQKGNVLIFADTRQQLVAALEQRQRSDRLTEDDFNGATSKLPSDALVRMYFDAQGLLGADPASAQARKVKWVAALRKIGLTASSQNDGISIDFNAQTDPSQLSEADLPVASGGSSPLVVIRPGEIGVGIRGLDQTIRFVQAAAQATSPASFGDFARAKAQLGRKIGVNLDRDVFGQLSGDTTISVDTAGHFAMRSEPKDPAAFAKTLSKLSTVAPSFAQGAGIQGARLTRVGNLYKLTGKGGKTIYYGMVGKVFAAANDPGRLTQIAAEAPQPVPGASGAIAINADAAKLIAGAISQAAGGGLGGAFGGSVLTAPLGSLTGSVNSSTGGLSGHLKLQIK